MRISMVLFVMLILIITSGLTFSQQGITKIKIGTFDSRCLAVAYGRSADFMKEVDSMKTTLAKAKEEDNKELIKELEQLGPTRQVLLHQQVFSNGSIGNILEKIKEKLPDIAKANSLNMILSKWEIPYADDTIELIDITDQLIVFFNPNEQTKTIIENIKTMEPIPIEKISINPMD